MALYQYPGSEAGHLHYQYNYRIAVYSLLPALTDVNVNPQQEGFNLYFNSSI
jgi:hypothetical protein